ncbi:MAG: TatD family hydrolase [Lachnospiraceae bacterium]|nr:TatD family hydrolase [Lachnospiraceae bacterium]
MIFDSHAHYDDNRFDADRETLLSGFPVHRIGAVVNVCADADSLQTTPALAEKYEWIYAAVGIHPSEIGDLDESVLDLIRQLAGKEKTVAIGEIGLDYYWEKDEKVRESQRFWFERQLSLAKETGLPVIIHSREAAKDTFEIMRKAAADRIPGVIHCYSYSAEQAADYVRMGYCIGIGGVVTFSNGRKLRETVEAVPLDRILLETDAPYLAPEPHRGERNSSLLLPAVVQTIAEIKGLSPREVEEVTWQNACALFGLTWLRAEEESGAQT